MTLADRARQVADAAPKHQSAEVLRECAAALDAKDADLAALRAVVGALLPYPEHDHPSNWIRSWGLQANAALAAAKKMAGGE